MTLVRLIVTGLAEKLGLGSFLSKIFPETEFDSQGDGQLHFSTRSG